MYYGKKVLSHMKTTNTTNSFGPSSLPLRNDIEASEQVDHPPHYTSHPSGIEAIVITRHESFLVGNVFKYLLRRKYKGEELQDLKKALWYLTEEVRRVEEQQSGSSD